MLDRIIQIVVDHDNSMYGLSESGVVYEKLFMRTPDGHRAIQWDWVIDSPDDMTIEAEVSNDIRG